MACRVAGGFKLGDVVRGGVAGGLLGQHQTLAHLGQFDGLRLLRCLAAGQRGFQFFDLIGCRVAGRFGGLQFPALIFERR